MAFIVRATSEQVFGITLSDYPVSVLIEPLLRALPHAAASFGHRGLNPPEQVLDELGVRRRVQIRVTGWLPTRSADPALSWLRDTAAALSPVPRQRA